eukprot:6554955-Heterocapsa_arctica.AAC.1
MARCGAVTPLTASIAIACRGVGSTSNRAFAASLRHRSASAFRHGSWSLRRSPGWGTRLTNRS